MKGFRIFPQIIGGFIAFVVFINIIGIAVEPYMPVIGKTFMILLLAIALAGFCFLGYGVYKLVMRERVGKEDDNNLGIGGWD